MMSLKACSQCAHASNVCRMYTAKRKIPSNPFTGTGCPWHLLCVTRTAQRSKFASGINIGAAIFSGLTALAEAQDFRKGHLHSNRAPVPHKFRPRSPKGPQEQHSAVLTSNTWTITPDIITHKCRLRTASRLSPSEYTTHPSCTVCCIAFMWWKHLRFVARMLLVNHRPQSYLVTVRACGC